MKTRIQELKQAAEKETHFSQQQVSQLACHLSDEGLYQSLLALATRFGSGCSMMQLPQVQFL